MHFSYCHSSFQMRAFSVFFDGKWSFGTETSFVTCCILHWGCAFHGLQFPSLSAIVVCKKIFRLAILCNEVSLNYLNYNKTRINRKSRSRISRVCGHFNYAFLYAVCFILQLLLCCSWLIAYRNRSVLPSSDSCINLDWDNGDKTMLFFNTRTIWKNAMWQLCN